MSLCAKNHKTFFSCPYDPLQCSEIQSSGMEPFFWYLFEVPQMETLSVAGLEYVFKPV